MVCETERERERERETDMDEKMIQSYKIRN